MVGIGARSRLAACDWKELIFVVEPGSEKATHPPSVAAIEATVINSLKAGTPRERRLEVFIGIMRIPFLYSEWLITIIFVVIITVACQP